MHLETIKYLNVRHGGNLCTSRLVRTCFWVRLPVSQQMCFNVRVLVGPSILVLKGKGKALPLQAWTGLEGG
jgi:hypothetical protein